MSNFGKVQENESNFKEVGFKLKKKRTMEQAFGEDAEAMMKPDYTGSGLRNGKAIRIDESMNDDHISRETKHCSSDEKVSGSQTSPF